MPLWHTLVTRAIKAVSLPKKSWVPIAIPVATLALTLLASSTIGSVEPIKPSGFGILRDVPLAGSNSVVPSGQDNILLPLPWKNTTGSRVLLQEPRLILTESGYEGNTGNEAPCNYSSDSPVATFWFNLAGEYPDITRDSIDTKPFTLVNTIILEPHSVTQKVLDFRPMHFWAPNKGSTTTYFQVPGDQKYDVDIEYRRAPVDTIGRDVIIRATDRNDQVEGSQSQDLSQNQEQAQLKPTGPIRCTWSYVACCTWEKRQ